MTYLTGSIPVPYSIKFYLAVFPAMIAVISPPFHRVTLSKLGENSRNGKLNIMLSKPNLFTNRYGTQLVANVPIFETSYKGTDKKPYFQHSWAPPIHHLLKEQKCKHCSCIRKIKRPKIGLPGTLYYFNGQVLVEAPSCVPKKVKNGIAQLVLKM